MFRLNAKTLVLGGLAVAAVAGALKNRDKVAGLIGARSSEPEPPRPEPGFSEPRPAHEATPAPARPASAPAPSNYDISGPAENTATRLPAPEPLVRGEGGVDEAAEEQAAAAEAAAIGGPKPEYAGRSLDERADEADRPLEESGEGVSEGQEQAEADMADNIEPSAGEALDAAARIEDVIEQQDEPGAGEIAEPLRFEASAVEDDQKTASEQPTLDFAGGKIGEERGAEAEAEIETAVEAETEPAVEAETEPAVEAETEPAVEPETEPAAKPAAEAPRTWSDIGRRPTLDRPEGAEPKNEAETSSGEGERSASEKSGAVWSRPDAASEKPGEPAKPDDRPIAGPGSKDDDDDDGGSEWQTWSGKAIRP